MNTDLVPDVIHDLRIPGETSSTPENEIRINSIKIEMEEILITKKLEKVGKSEVYFYCIITEFEGDKPIEIKSQLFKKIKKNMVIPFSNGDGEIYKRSSHDIPTFVDFRIVVFESDERVRKMGEALKVISESDEYKKAKKVIQEIGSVSIPYVNAISSLADVVLKGLSIALSHAKDDQMNFTKGTLHPYQWEPNKSETFVSEGSAATLKYKISVQ